MSLISTDQLIEDLITLGGAVVGSQECSPLEIAFAIRESRMAVRTDGIGLVRRTAEWLDRQKSREPVPG